MAIEKMMLVRATGSIDKLNEFNLKIMTSDYYHPETAVDYFLPSQGYHAVADACPFDQSIKHIEDIAQLADGDLSAQKAEGLGGDFDAAYIKKLIKYLSENDFDSSDINSFLSGLKPYIDSYSRQHIELLQREKYLHQKIENLSHFLDLDVDLDEILGTSYIEVHFGRIPKDSMVKLYMYNNENKFLFNTYSSDEKNFWGIYCVPVQYSEDAAKIMSALYFEELQIDPDDGSIKTVIARCRQELEQIAKKQNEIHEFWDRNKDELSRDYSILLDLQTLWSFRKYAVKKDDTFCCIGWVPKKLFSQAKNLLGSISDIEFTIKDPEKSVTANADLNNPGPFERPIRDIEHLSHHVSYDLSPERLHNVIGNDKPLTEDYLKKFTKFLGGANLNSQGMSLSGLNGEIHAFSLMRKELKAREKYLKKKLKRLSHFTTLDVDLGELLSVSYTEVHFGRLPREWSEQIQKMADSEQFVYNVYSSDEKNCWCIYCVPKKYSAEINALFEKMYFKEYRIDDPWGSVNDIIARCNEELQAIAAQKQQITDFWNAHKDEIIDCYSILQDLQRLWTDRKNISLKNGKVVYSGHLTKTQKKELQTLYEAVGGFEGLEDDNESTETRQKLTPPTRLKNLRIFRPYEYYVEMYGMPDYASADITSFVAVTYTILFGIMFGDLGQGLILTLFGALAWKIKKMPLGKILIPCGISSMLFGLVFGSVFGFEEALDPLYHALGMSGKPISVMDNINTVLLLAISIGIALVAVAILINMYVNIKAKRYGAALFDNNGAAGLAFYLCGVNLCSGIMNGPTPIPGAVCAVVMVICGVILFLKELLIGAIDRREKKKPDSISDFLMQNLFEMLEYVLSYFSNTVSFLRIGAFVLVHAGMMMVVFSLAGESHNIFVIILGNALVICLEALLTGIQALRLEFYEMFSRCFEGSGKQFISAKQLLADKNK